MHIKEHTSDVSLFFRVTLAKQQLHLVDQFANLGAGSEVFEELVMQSCVELRLF